MIVRSALLLNFLFLFILLNLNKILALVESFICKIKFSASGIIHLEKII